MKLVKAYIRPILLEDVYNALRNKNHCCMTVFEGEGTGRFSDPNKKHGSLTFPAMHSHMVNIEIAATAEDVSEIVEIIKENGRTGRKGDGIIYVVPIEQATRIQDGKKGSDILN